MSSARRSTSLLALAFVAFGAPASNAQPPQTGSAAATAAREQGTGSPNGGKLITPADIKAWKSVRQTELSNDGKYFAYVVAPNEGDATLIVRGTARGATETRIPVGNNGGQPRISGDSKWLGFIVAPPTPPNDSGARGRGAGRGGARGGGAAPQGADSAANRRRVTTNTFVLMNLATGERKEFPHIRRFSFNTDHTPTWVAMQGYPIESGTNSGAAPAEPAGRRGGGPGRGGAGGGGGATNAGGGNLLLYNLTTAEQFNMGLVDEFAFNDSGAWLAYTMDAPDRVGNGVQLRNMKTSEIRAVESEPLVYRHLAWIDSTDVLTVMRGQVDDAAPDTVFSIEAFRDFGPSGPSKTLAFDPSHREDFPAGWKLASDRAPRYADDLSAVFFGIREANKAPVRGQVASNGRGGNSLVRPGAPGAGGRINQPGTPGGTGNSAAEEPSLILWHAKDPRLQSQQIVQEQADRAFNYLSEYRFGDDRFVQLVTDSMRSVTLMPKEHFAYGVDTRAYDQPASYSGRNYQDVYRVDLATGTHTLIMKKRPAVGPMSASPDGRKLLYWGHDGNWWVLDLPTGDSVNVTRRAPVTFVNTEDDHNNIYPPPTRALGWAKDGSAVLLYDNWDIWKVPANPAAGSPVNLTGDGRRTQIRYQRLYQFDAAGGGGGGGFGGRFGGAGNPIDLSKPLYVGTYGEWSKKEGLSRIDPGQAGARSLFFDDARFNVIKAQDADTYLYTRQNFNEYPNYWVFGPGFKDGYQITDVDPQMKDFAWSSGARLIDYRSDKGDRLQGALYLPANYQPGKKYPLLVTIYEKRSQNMRSFVSPSETRAPDPTLFTNRGYAVLDPDIVYRVNDPGMSAVWCVVPAVKAAIATGIVDPKHVGLWGHSWGGYQTAFLVTQTNIFSAAIAGAPLTDMVSMYSSIYWNTGGTNQAIFEASQGRFKGNFLDNYDAYIRNSPAFHADKVTTPLIILHNDKDGAVDFNQGITYFNTLRQLGKDVILLEYVGENHGLARPVNQKDYAGRMAEWFDYHLKDAPPEDWIVNGVPRIKMEDHLKARRDSTGKVIVP